MNSFFHVDESYPSIFLCVFFFLFLFSSCYNSYVVYETLVIEYLNIVLDIEIFLRTFEYAKGTREEINLFDTRTLSF